MSSDPTTTPSTTVPADSTAASAEPSVTPISPPSEPAQPSVTAPLESETAPAAEAENKDEKPSDVEEEEPQNALTRQFTEEEWKAVKVFRRELSQTFAEAFPDTPDAATTPVTFWGVTLDPKGPKNARATVVLMKFLRARNLSVYEAKEMLISTLRWRQSFNVDAANKEEFDEDIFGSLGYIFGKDKEGRPIVYNLYGANKDLKAVFGDVPRFIRWRVAFMEKCVSFLDFETVDQMIQVHDYEGVSFTSRDANSKNAASECSSIFQNHYPELLFKKFFVNVPSVLAWVFWIFKPLISANTLAKMSVVGSGSSAIGKAILPFVDPKELPKAYGGESEGF
ncbi:hypothetical protein JAAARDRAFT_62786 [Jaapia argillacea MUCL 33604]|uniref:Phosphatidylinositol transfer protein SFH5 n=1 Tax=Jaapia argillacea MUCL 33604 TaxID=933084 RepID=A0A067PKQ8_9AGAM|nr:hypothetical protein JAAARDRAFT_62786 [Jaapia argillacea MUCL 33604]